MPLHAERGTFAGYPRPGGRGVGTRNVIVLLGTTSLSGSFVKALEARLRAESARLREPRRHRGGGAHRGRRNPPPNNLEFVLRTLAGFIVNPNVAACLAVDYGSEVFTNAMLEEYMRAHGYPLEHVLHRFYSIRQDHAAALDECAQIVRQWFEPASAMPRSAQPLSQLRIGLQCGGSDAFSGVSGNPLAGWVAREVIRHGGSANLAETDELIGAESYILANTRDLATAQRFLEKIEIFKERVAWHGHSAEGNPTGGNKFRGLYNIAIKSIGAARKKDPDVRLDYVIDYGERMTQPGYYFMDSPGNDLESIAGQIAAGCNLIFFTTGNGSITNFPFVPTIKFITTTGRWNLLSKDMDVNAGRYLDGAPMEELGMETFHYTVEVASGTRSVGERAGHSQVSIWRDWQQTDRSRLDELQNAPAPDGQPIPVVAASAEEARFGALLTPRGYVPDQVGLIMPTSLCSGQIALRIARELNETIPAGARGVSRFVALPHTEGCGASAGENEEHQLRTMAGHLLHPFVRTALLLEHGCERTHNDLMRHALEERGIDPGRFGYASIQLDGGIDKVVRKVEHWFLEQLPAAPPAERHEVGLEALSLGLLSIGHVSLARGARAGADRGGDRGQRRHGRYPRECFASEIGRVHRGTRLDRRGHTEPAVWSGRRAGGSACHGHAHGGRRGNRDGSRRHRRAPDARVRGRSAAAGPSDGPRVAGRRGYVVRAPLPPGSRSPDRPHARRRGHPSRPARAALPGRVARLRAQALGRGSRGLPAHPRSARRVALNN